MSCRQTQPISQRRYRLPICLPTIPASAGLDPRGAATHLSRSPGTRDYARTPEALCRELERTRVLRKRKCGGSPVGRIFQSDRFLTPEESLSDRTTACWHQIEPFPKRSSEEAACPGILHF